MSKGALSSRAYILTCFVLVGQMIPIVVLPYQFLSNIWGPIWSEWPWMSWILLFPWAVSCLLGIVGGLGLLWVGDYAKTEKG